MGRVVGYGVSQVPTNGMLGGMAYQDPINVTVNNISVGSGTLTGTASQPLQVTGGAYVSGYFGIGSTNPQRKLDVSGDATTIDNNATIRVLTTNTTGYGAALTLNATSITSGRSYILKSSGNSDSAGVGKFAINDASANIDRLVIDSSGNLGIGTNSINSKVQIVADSIPGDNGSMVTIATGGGNLVNKLNFGVSSVNNYAWIQSVKPGTDVYPLLLNPSGGNVGINTTAPIKKLHVQTSFVSGAARGGGFTQILFESNQASATYWEFQANASSTNDILFSKSSVGGSSYGIVGYDHATDALRFYSNSNERLRIDSAGRVTMPSQPAWNLRPNGNSNVTTTTNANIVGWSNNTYASSAKLCHIQGVTLTGSSSGIHGATSSGRINFPVAGRYKVWCTIRCENMPGTGNIYFYINGVQLSRQHVEGWGSTYGMPYHQGFQSQIINVAANDFLEIEVSPTAGAIISGYNDTVNWCGGYLIG